MMNRAQLNIGIAGAGIIGRLIALQLMQRGHKVTLFDKDPIDDGDACSYTAAGMLTPYSEAESAEPLVFQLGQASLTMWPEIIQALGADVHYHTGGTLVAAHRQDQADFSRFTNAIHHRLDPDTEQFRLVDRHQLAALEPELATHFHQAAYIPDEAWLCACCVMPSLGDALLAGKVSWHSSTEVATIRPHEITVKARIGERSHCFDTVIDCRGLGAKDVLPSLRGVRGELLWVRAPQVKIKRLVRLMHPRYRLYVVPRRDDLYLIGATQIESEDRSEISVRSSLELLSAAYSIHPGFAEGRVIKSDVNLRPALPDNLPQISHREGLILVNGLFRHGYLMSPAIGAEVVDLVERGAHFQPRFPELMQPLEVAEHQLQQVTP